MLVVMYVSSLMLTIVRIRATEVEVVDSGKSRCMEPCCGKHVRASTLDADLFWVGGYLADKFGYNVRRKSEQNAQKSRRILDNTK